ncbi:hypothetical protein OROHE_014624 [Orobanche hederae]
MSEIYDNWERLVAAVLKRQQLWRLFHDHSRSPSILSEASNFNSSFSSRSYLDDLPFDLAKLGSSLWSSLRDVSKLVLISDFSAAIDVKYIYLASSEFIGRGTFGSVYTATMDNGARIVVKRLKLMSLSEKDFKRHMDIVGNVRHENVAALRGYYSSKDERLMLYDYYRKGSVYALLYGRNGEPQAHVDWESRLKIAIGGARGIAYIHKHNGGKLVHGNIRASNVFLNPDEYGCISDLGLTNKIETEFMPAAHCYAPEVKKTQNLSQGSDVYSFGVLLLELLTRKSPVHVPGGPKAADLVQSGYFCIKQNSGMRCVEKSIKKRPKMSEVVKLLEEIAMANPISHTPMAGELVFIGDANPTFGFEDVLRASAVVLGKGTFGTSYKMSLGNGNTIVAKRLRDLVVTFEEFQHHMEITRRMRHQNISDVKAYAFYDDYKLLLYDYYNQDSVSALLHGRGGTHLEWETRLKIAVGAARGICHIHRQDKRKFVHGNVKSSNIFFNRQRYGIVANAGLAKLTSPLPVSVLRTPGSYAPEVTDSGRVSQASDVYGFGVVLLELLSRKPSQFTGNDGKVTSLVEWIQSLVPDEWITKVFDLEFMRCGIEEETMVQALQIATDCVSIVPESRPRMSEVVEKLEVISGIEPLNASRLEETWEQPSIESRLEDLLEDLLPKLTP